MQKSATPRRHYNNPPPNSCRVEPSGPGGRRAESPARGSAFHRDCSPRRRSPSPPPRRAKSPVRGRVGSPCRRGASPVRRSRGESSVEAWLGGDSGPRGDGVLSGERYVGNPRFDGPHPAARVTFADYANERPVHSDILQSKAAKNPYLAASLRR